MRTPDAPELLHAWEHGMHAPAAGRALLLMATACDDGEQALARWTIGQRDRLLLDLRELLFGPHVECLTTCPHCGEAIELELGTADIRLPHGEPGRAYPVSLDDYDVRFRLPDSTDVLSLDGTSLEAAEQQMLARCVLDVRKGDEQVPAEALPASVAAAVIQMMSEVDPQAEVLLDVACPACAATTPAPFDIVSHVWTELSAWAMRMLSEVHVLASAYGWSEADILAMSAVRRHVYLERLAQQEHGTS